MELNEKPQVDVQAAEPSQQLPASQPETPAAPAQPAAEVTPQAPVEKPEESQQVAAARREAAQAKQQLAEISMRQEIQRLQQEEASARARDRADVEAGSITPEEAGSRSQLRSQKIQLEHMVQRLAPQAEQLGRIKMADDLAKEYGINADDLIKDTSIQSPMQMMQKAAKLAIKTKDEALRAATTRKESFDRGPVSPTPGPKTEEKRLQERYPSMYK